MSTGQDIIDRVRDTIQDEDTVLLRVSDAKMLKLLNDALKEACIVAPHLFSSVGDIPCVPGTVHQAIPAGKTVLSDIYRIKDGTAVTEVKRAHLDRFQPSWPTDPAGPAENWIRDEKDPARFFVYPKAPDPQTLVGQWSVASSLAALGDTLALAISPAYDTALHHYVVFRCEARDDEAVLSGRAKLFYDGFAALLGAGMKSEAVTAKPERENANQNAG